MVDRAQAEARVGSVIADKYELKSLLGHGGMGSVYEAVHRFTGRRVAVKLMHAGLAQVSGLSKRFVREARAPSAIGHPGLVDVLDGGEDHNGELYLVMEYLDGETLGAALRRSDFDGFDFVKVVVELLDTLGAAHSAGFMHRDIKPDNVFITHATQRMPRAVKLLDFGIAGLLHGVGATQLTVTGAVLGTPAYMSPEQAGGRRVDATSDVWAVGAMLYRGLAGRPPYQGTNYNEIVVAIASTEHPPLANLRPDLPRDLTEVVDHALARDPLERFRDANDMHRALEAAARDPRVLDVKLRQTPAAERPAETDATPVLSSHAAGPAAAATVPRRKHPGPRAPGPSSVANRAATQATVATHVEPTPGPASRGHPGAVTSVRPHTGARKLVWVAAALTVAAALLVIGARLQRRSAAEAARAVQAHAATSSQPAVGQPTATAAEQEGEAEPRAPTEDTTSASAATEQPSDESPAASATEEPKPSKPVSAGVTAAELSKVVALGQAGLKRCHQAAIGAGHRDNVSLHVDLMVNTSGRVDGASTRGSAPRDLPKCVEDEVKRWRFAPPDVPTEVSFPIDFEAVVVQL